ncbi:hypothetical protein B9Z55_018207 [Caenorhabditis nigoni]|nr:hypothetical protein B9Z55_018207 [Caenorhabditis nigoni]
MGNFNGKRVVFIISSVYVPVVIMIILPFTVPWDFETVRLATYKDHPTYNFTIYEPIGGFASNDTFQFIFNTGLVAMSSYVIPVVTGILTKRTLKMINKNSVVSSKTKQQSKTLTYGLALQNILPAFSYVPPATAWIISQFGEVEVLWNEHLLIIFISFPPLLDPLLTFYFVVPFRHAIYNFMTFKKTAQDTVTTSNQSGKWFGPVQKNTVVQTF